MDNIIIEKVYEDSDLMEMKISIKSKFVVAHQYFYVQGWSLEEMANMIYEYTKDFNRSYYYESGEKEGRIAPVFSFEIFPTKSNGSLKIEVDLEINDNNSRKHRCSCYIDTNIGAVERFGKSLINLITGDVGSSIQLN